MKKLWNRLGLLVWLMLVVAACQDDDLTPLMPEEQEEPSAIDTLPWPLTKNMDTANYRPGDDFFMYCNGGFWNATSLGDEMIVGCSNNWWSCTTVLCQSQATPVAVSMERKP